MDNWKRALSESGRSEGTGSRFRREPNFGKLAERQEPAGFGTTGLNRRTDSGWRRFQGDIKFPDAPPSFHICVSAL